MGASASKKQLTAKMLDHVLAHGLHQANLPDLAQAAGVSEAALLEHYGDWNGVLFDVLTGVAYGFEEVYMNFIPAGVRLPAIELYRRMTDLTDGAWMQPYNQLWAEMIVIGARGDGPAGPIARDVVRGFAELIDAHLAIDDPVMRRQIAALLVVQSDVTCFYRPIDDANQVDLARTGLNHLLEQIEPAG